MKLPTSQLTINEFKSISPRELEVLRELVLTGDSNSQIGERLFICEKSVRAHLSSLFKKLNVSNRGQLIVRSLKYFYKIENIETTNQ